MTTYFYKTGNIFKTSCSTLVNPTNCIGPMGKGLALQFKKKYPNLEIEYKRYCKEHDVQPGDLFIFNSIINIICLPTKDHWKDPSKIEYIEKGLDSLRELIMCNNYTNIAIPALGCGLGELEWTIVKQTIIDKLNNIDNLEVEICEPLETNIVEE